MNNTAVEKEETPGTMLYYKDWGNYLPINNSTYKNNSL
jgi:hypothetical protein